jgi:hypothetical protein
MRRNLPAVSAVLAVALVTACASVPKASPEPFLASEVSAIVQSYDQYNAELRSRSVNVFGKTNVDSFKRYYTKAMSEKHDQCSWIPFCQMSDEIGLKVATMMDYRVISLEEKNGNLARLIVIGTNAHGLERSQVVLWKFEDGKWRIDQVITGPPNW